MPYRLGSPEDFLLKNHYATLHHAVSNAGGVILFVYGPRGRLILTQNVRPEIEQHLSMQILSTGWGLVNDQALAVLLTEREDIDINPLVKRLKGIIRRQGR